LFNYQFLKQQNARASNSSYYSGPEYKSPSDWATDPTYSSRPGNMYHRIKHHR
jgi:hypothetical protein